SDSVGGGYMSCTLVWQLHSIIQRSRVHEGSNGRLAGQALKGYIWMSEQDQALGFMLPLHIHRNVYRFLYVPAPHTSARLANRLCKSLLEWNIDKPETKPSDLEGLFSAMAVEEEPEDKVPWPAMEPQL
ncbi:hypothetical protein LINPERHAP2_LOCUS42172, partial [Linum perenne]